MAAVLPIAFRCNLLIFDHNFFVMKNGWLIWLLSLLLIACSRISAKEHLETITEIQLPKGYSVLNEQYRNNGQDFFLQYEIRFDQDSARQMVAQIEASKYYSSQGAQLLYDSVWYTDKRLYRFEAKNETGDTKYEIVFNPATGVLNYLEYSERMKL